MRALLYSNRSSNGPTDCERTRPQDRNAVAALASKIDPMLAQSRSFVTVQDNDSSVPLFGIRLAGLKCGSPWDTPFRLTNIGPPSGV